MTITITNRLSYSISSDNQADVEAINREIVATLDAVFHGLNQRNSRTNVAHHFDFSASETVETATPAGRRLDWGTCESCHRDRADCQSANDCPGSTDAADNTLESAAEWDAADAYNDELIRYLCANSPIGARVYYEGNVGSIYFTLPDLFDEDERAGEDAASVYATPGYEAKVDELPIDLQDEEGEYHDLGVVPVSWTRDPASDAQVWRRYVLRALLSHFGEAAKPVRVEETDDGFNITDDWGSERQLRAETRFCRLVEMFLSREDFADFSAYALKATTEEMIEHGLALSGCARPKTEAVR